MDRKTLSERIASISDPKAFTFFEDGQAVESRFNLTDSYEGYNKGSLSTDVSKALYALVANLSVVKAKGREEATKGSSWFALYLHGIVDAAKDPAVRKPLLAEMEKAKKTVDAFLFSTEKVTMADILARVFPLVLVKFSLREGQVEKKTFQTLSKSREVLFRQAALFVRSLFQSFLTLKTTDPFSIRIDVENLDAPYFVYKNTLVLATDRDAFSLPLLKEDMLESLQALPKAFSLKDVDSVAVLFLLRTVFAVASLN